MYYTSTKDSATTTNTGKDLDIRKLDTRAATVLVRNTGAKNAKVQLKGSIDGETFVNIGSEETVNAGASKVFSVTDYWPRLRVTAKPATEGEQTTVHVESASVDA